MDIEVWKFGGASLADGKAIVRAAAQIAGHRGPLVVVASALAGVTDLLLQGATDAAFGRAPQAARAAATFREKHERALRDIGLKNKTLVTLMKESVDEYEHLCSGVAVLAHLDPRTQDVLVARGERLSARLLAAAVAHAGRKTQYIDATEIVRTDAQHAGATPRLDASSVQARKILRPLLSKRTVAIVPGFIGQAPDGSVTTLGRGGSDLTATLLGRALGAKQVQLWKDVPGILTADPRMVPDARVIPEMHHREAGELAHYGAKVLHPRALIPIADTRVTLHVRSFINPVSNGTIVSGRKSLDGYPVKAIAVLPAQAVVTVAGKGMIGVHGVAAKTFAAVDAAGLSVSTIFQASSESSIGFTVPEADADRAVHALRKAFQRELDQRLIDGVSAKREMAVIAVVGDGMVGTPGISARVFGALARGRINIVAIAQGSSERNISFVVSAADAAEATRRVHAEFQLSKIGGGRGDITTHTDVVLLGFGRVGRELTDQLGTQPDFRIVALMDRSGYVFNPKGLSKARLMELASDKDKGALLSQLGGRKASAIEALTTVASHAVSDPIVVDVTSEETGSIIESALVSGFEVVLANKKPLAGSWESYQHLWQIAREYGRAIRFEATVGAGLPIIDTFKKLDEAGDRVLSIEGCVSGTLMHVLSAVSAGRPFSEAVREAVDRGYAEPDPRDDLSGRDAARKGLILGRMLGYEGPPPTAEDLVPRKYAGLKLADFMRRLPELDASWRDKVARADEKGQVYRYVVSASPRRVTAGLKAVPRDNPMGMATGTSNIIVFRSKRYKDVPLVVSGPGAGAAVTAAGIVNDLCTLVRS
ncbi:MAG TPA: aspartate kinase [Vicinamibacterales bacterium]|nr:aspartate kinase [Vicinamibacterales bacterium]